MTDEHNQEQHRNILDEIEQEADQNLHPILQKILDNLKPIGIGIGALILVVGAYSGYTTYAKVQVKKLNDELGTILIQEDPAKRITSLNQFLADHPSKMPVGTLLEVAASAMTSNNYPEAASAWSKVADASRGEIRILALLGQARALSLDEKYRESLSVLESIDTTDAKDLATPVARQVAFAAEQAQDWQKALTAYEELKSMGAVTNTAFLDMKIADIKAKMI
jgi:tetratricopeptide (TPR) repeat protein